MLNFERTKIELNGLSVEVLPSFEHWSKYDFTLYVREEDERFRLSLVYNADLFNQDRMVELLDQFKQLLSQCTDRPDERVSQYSLVTIRSTQLIPNPTLKLSSKWEGSIARRFIEQSRKDPEHPAVIDERGTWSYGELDLRSNRLANYLHVNGIESQDVVAIYGQRSASLIWAILGVVKAGACFESLTLLILPHG